MLTQANRTGFTQTANNLFISKDPAATLIYTFDWSQWLDSADTISTAEYSVVARRNDPAPVVIESEGVDGVDKTYVELSGGQQDKSYVVACTVTTVNGLVDKREFRLNVEARTA